MSTATIAVAPGVSVPCEGRLASTPLETLLGLLGAVRANGALDISRRKLVRRFVLEHGELVVVVSNAREDRLLEWAAARELIDAGLAGEMAKAAGSRPLTASVLFAFGAGTPESVGEMIRAHLAALLADSARWGDATFAFRAGRVPIGDEPRAGLSALAAALDLARAQRPSRRALPDWVRSLAPELPADMGLTELQARVVAACAEGAAVAALAEKTGKPSLGELHADLELLLRAGLLVAAPAPVPAAGDPLAEVTQADVVAWIELAEAEDLPGLLGAPDGSEPEHVRRAYYRAVRRFHPDRFRQGPLAGYHKQIEQAFRLLHEALEVMTDPAARVAWETRRHVAPPDPSRAGRELWERAHAAARAGQRADAVALLERAIGYSAGEPMYRLAHAILLTGNPRRRSEAAQTLLALAREHPARADILAAAGLGLRRANRAAEGDPLVTRALQIDPAQPLALASLGDSEAKERAAQDPFWAVLLA
ncbi:MAG: DnaJ domain-containing protein [Acidobacteria bacterium]|nr:DnaJ domain-containing protein [Acidobacteriota bacterium]